MCAGLTGVPVIVEARAEFSLLPSLNYVLPAADLRFGTAGRPAQAQHSQGSALASSHSFHIDTTSSQRLIPPQAIWYGTWGNYASCECRCASHGGQVRGCQTPAAAGELDVAAQPQGVPAAAEEAVLRTVATAEADGTLSSDNNCVSLISEAQTQLEQPPDAFEIAAADSVVESPLSALDIARNISERQPQDPAARPKHGRPSHSARSQSEAVSLYSDDSITSVPGPGQMPSRQASGNEFASLEQSGRPRCKIQRCMG